MSDLREMDITELMNEMADEGLKAESTLARTVPTGKYTLRYQGFKAYEDDKGIPFASYNVIFEQDGIRKGSGFFKATWKKERASTGKLTRRASLYGQLLKALDLPEDTPVQKVADSFQSQLLGAFVIESLMSPENQFVRIGEHQERDGQVVEVTRREANDLIASGWKPFNSVNSVYKLRG